MSDLPNPTPSRVTAIDPPSQDVQESSDYSEGLGTIVSAEAHGQRLDRLLTQWFPEQSRARLQQWIEAGAVSIDGQVARKASQSVKEGQRIWAIAPEPEPSGDWVAEPVPIEIVHEDTQILVINKQSGLVVHPAAGHASGTLLNGLLWHAPALRALPRAGIVHRLDRETTGLMVIAKTLEAQTDLVRQLQARTMGRRYFALAWGDIRQRWIAEGPIGRDPADRQRMAVLAEGEGKPAYTEFSPTAHGTIGARPATLLRCALQTGRTHQIRVHLEHARHPIVGDPTYRKTAPRVEPLAIDRQALHAYALSLSHPESQTTQQFTAPVPPDFGAVLEQATIPCPSLSE
ncbi:MAG: RluA family pseudouridine synthase [Burkholderiaceae bacterium]